MNIYFDTDNGVKVFSIRTNGDTAAEAVISGLAKAEDALTIIAEPGDGNKS